MSIKPPAFVALLLLAGVVWAHPATAQVSTPDNAIEDRARQQVRLPSQEEREEALLTGDTDIVLTRPTRLFTLHAAVETVLTDNAFLSEASPVTDGYVQAQAGLGMGTRIGGKVDVFADAGLVSVRYFDQQALDYSALTGLVGVAVPVGPVRLSATYQPVMVFERDFTSKQLTTHRLQVAASLPFVLGPAVAEPRVSLERTLASPSDYEAWSGGAGLTVSMPLSRSVPVLVFASAEYQRREFDAYFPGLLGVDRKDDVLAAGAGVVWRPNGWGEVRAGWNFQRNWSTSDVNRYQAHSGNLGVSARLRF